MYRLVAIDLDGTLLSTGHRLSDANRDAVNALMAAGTHVVIATGRPFDIVRVHCEGIDLTGPQITYNGAVVYDASANRVLSQELVPPSEVPAVLELLHDREVPTVACGVSRVYMDSRIKHPEDWVLPPSPRAEVLADMRSAPPDGLIKIVAESDRDTIDRLRPLAVAAFSDSLYVTQTAPTLLEFLNPASSKGAALRRIAESLNIQRDEILAFGDSHNDLTMFRIAGRSVAMGNAADEVKAAADCVAPSNDEDGVAAVLHRLGLLDGAREARPGAGKQG